MAGQYAARCPALQGHVTERRAFAAACQLLPSPLPSWPIDVAEPYPVNKPAKSYPRPLSDLLHKTLHEAFAKQGFASTELVTRWTEIAGTEIAAHSQPEKIQWSRPHDGKTPEPGTLVLRVEGPMAIEIQHLSGVILERVNRFFGWQAVGSLRLRQAPLRRTTRKPLPVLDPAATARVAADLAAIADADLRDALARLGAAIKQS
jgi:hypothetical protein